MVAVPGDGVISFDRLDNCVAAVIVHAVNVVVKGDDVAVAVVVGDVEGGTDVLDGIVVVEVAVVKAVEVFAPCYYDYNFAAVVEAVAVAAVGSGIPVNYECLVTHSSRM